LFAWFFLNVVCAKADPCNPSKNRNQRAPASLTRGAKKQRRETKDETHDENGSNGNSIGAGLGDRRVGDRDGRFGADVQSLAALPAK
jgi:hypothetical protein